MIASGELRRQLDHVEKLADALALLCALQAEVELDRTAENVVDPLARIERGIRHLEDELHLLQLAAFALVEAGLQPVAVQQDLPFRSRAAGRT